MARLREQASKSPGKIGDRAIGNRKSEAPNRRSAIRGRLIPGRNQSRKSR